MLCTDRQNNIQVYSIINAANPRVFKQNPKHCYRACNPEDHCTREVEGESWPERQCYRACSRKDHRYEANLAGELPGIFCRWALVLGMYESVGEITLDMIGTWCCAVFCMHLDELVHSELLGMSAFIGAKKYGQRGAQPFAWKMHRGFKCSSRRELCEVRAV